MVDETDVMPADPLATILTAFTDVLIERLGRGKDMVAAELNVVRMTLNDFSVEKEKIGEEGSSAATRLINGYIKELLRRLKSDGNAMSAADLNVVRATLADFSITLSRIPQGDLSQAAQLVKEEFPFDERDQPITAERMH